MPAKCYDKNKATLCLQDGKRYWTGMVTKQDSDCIIRGTKGATVCWTYLTHTGMSDGGGVQDQARRNRDKKVKEVLKALTEG